jgi:photosystem II stability/assembly factor-like uncharacterized protein
MRRRLTLVSRAVSLLATLALVSPLAGQSRTPPEPGAPTGGPFDRLRWRSIGPASMSGRIDDLAVLERDPRFFYVAAATGGLWKTTNGGVTFTPVFDSTGGMVSIGAVAIGADDPNLVWVGTGENNNRQSSSWGDGVYKSTDGGQSWKNMGLRESKQISRIVIDPLDRDVVYVAALGELWKGGGERGIYKTTDGGVTWTKVLDAGLDAGGTELAMDPSNNKVLYAATYQRRRSSWGMNGGGPNSGLWKTSDAGRTWTRLTKGIPEGPLGRIGFDIWRKNPSVIYARIEHEKESGVYRTDDAGLSWRKMGSTNGRPMYFGVIRVDPANDLRVYLPMTPMGVSDDGGKTFRTDGAPNVHVDFHAMWIDPRDPEHMMTGSDGGVAVTRDKGKNWMWFPNLPVGQFYHVGYDMEDPYNVCGGLQDNSSWCGPSQVRSGGGITNHHWHTVQGGDGFVGLIDPTNHRIIYAESQDGFMSRVDRVTNEAQSIRPEAPEGEPPYRWNWDTPMILSPHDPATIYVGGNKLFMSTDRGLNWKAVSPDLTTGVDRDTVELMGVKGKDIKIAKNDGVDSYGTLFTIAESRKKKGLLYTGSDDGQVQVSRDGGATWTNVTGKIPGAPRWAYVSKVEPSRFDEGTVYVTYDAHRTGDYGTYVYQSTDYGSSWKSLAGTLPRGEVVRTITEDQKNQDVLYLGTETGLFVSIDRGRSWIRVRANLPTVPIYEITLHPRDNAMILATHGRALWILDDLGPIQQYATAQTAAAFLFEPRPVAFRSVATERQDDSEGDMRFLGQNPPVGVTLTYQLRTTADSVRLVIKDPAGATIRELKGDAVKGKDAAGMNLVQWNLRSEPILPAKKPQGPPAPSPLSFFLPNTGDPGTPGPVVLPGDYRVALVVNGKEAATRSVTVRGDPDVTISQQDRESRFKLLKELQQLTATASDAADALRAADQQLKAVKTELADSTKVPAPIRAAMDSLGKELDPLKKTFGIRDPNEEFDFSGFRKILPLRVALLGANIGGVTAPPTAQDLQSAADVRRLVPKSVDDVNAFLAKLKPFFQRLASEGLYPPIPAAVKKP